MQRGKFISFEGSEGCGKSTQIQKVASWLRERGVEVLLTREPGGTAIGERIRDLLQHDRAGEGMTPECELLLFAASRAQLVREVIAPALEAGKWVLADRFYDSTYVYQGVARGLDREMIGHLRDFVVGEIRPELTVLLDLDAEVGISRARADTLGLYDRIEQEAISFFELVRSGFLDLAEAEPERIVVIDAQSALDVVFSSLCDLLQTRFPELSS